jgi:predicted PurR-regulated permease PerM
VEYWGTGSWHDSFGRAAVRAGQALVRGAAGAVVIWLLVTLRLVVVPLVIATIIATAVSPLMRALRVRGVPPALAAIAAPVAGLHIQLPLAAPRHHQHAP